MSALDMAMQEYRTRRMIEMERRSEGAEVRGDFVGSVKAAWVRLDQGGAGIALYKGREYKTRTVGFSSLPKGSVVELSYAKGVYFASF
jgi:hypothetical protein